jgi:hypothetical protein
MEIMEQFQIFFSDLKKESQDALCEAFGTTPEKENWNLDMVPLAILEREVK